MSRYIDADALLSKMVNEPVKAVDGVDFYAEWFTRIADTAVQFTDMVKNAPTVDAVPVVRCGECEHRKPPTDYCEKLCKAYVPDDFYCKYGERTHG